MTEKITLSEPIKKDGIEIQTLSMREPTVEDMLAIRKTTAPTPEQEIELFSNLCQLEPENMLSIKWKDYLKIQRTYSKLIGEENPLD
jgi:hypothetical protein